MPSGIFRFSEKSATKFFETRAGAGSKAVENSSKFGGLGMLSKFFTGLFGYFSQHRVGGLGKLPV